MDKIRFYDDKKEKWQSYEIHLDLDIGMISSYGRDKKEALTNLKNDIETHIKETQEALNNVIKILKAHAEENK